VSTGTFEDIERRSGITRALSPCMRLPVAGIFPHAIRKDNAPGAAFPIHSTQTADSTLIISLVSDEPKTAAAAQGTGGMTTREQTPHERQDT
jgi:hypothetical protein